MKQKCKYCKSFKITGIGSPGRNKGKCKYFDDAKLPYWAKGKNYTLEKSGANCEVFEEK